MIPSSCLYQICTNPGTKPILRPIEVSRVGEWLNSLDMSRAGIIEDPERCPSLFHFTRIKVNVPLLTISKSLKRRKA